MPPLDCAFRFLEPLRSIEATGPRCPSLREPWNTVSNAGLGVFGLAGVVEDWGNPRLCALYLWMLARPAWCGATRTMPFARGSAPPLLVLDLAPILVSVVLNLAYGTLAYWTPTARSWRPKPHAAFR